MLYDSGMDHRNTITFYRHLQAYNDVSIYDKIEDCIMIAGDYECIDSLNSLSVNAVSYSTLYGLHL